MQYPSTCIAGEATLPAGGVGDQTRLGDASVLTDMKKLTALSNPDAPRKQQTDTQQRRRKQKNGGEAAVKGVCAILENSLIFIDGIIISAIIDYHCTSSNALFHLAHSVCSYCGNNEEN